MIQLRHFDERIYDPDLGKGVSSTQVVAKYLDKKNPQDYYISFTAIDKIGINPKSNKDFQEKFSAGWNSTVDEIAALKGVFVSDDLDVRF